MLGLFMYLFVTICLIMYGVKKNNDAVLMAGTVMLLLCACIEDIP